MCLIMLICHWMACGWYAVSLIGVSRYLEEQTRLNDEVSLTYYDTALVDQFDSSDYSFQVYSNTSLLRSIIEEYSNLGIISISGVSPGITVPCCHYVFRFVQLLD